MARPTVYSQEVLEKAKKYLAYDRPCDIETTSGKIEEVIPTIEGLALYAEVARSTIYNWLSQGAVEGDEREDMQEFLDIVNQILEKQGLSLANNGLANKFNAKIAAVMLSKHGYREGKEFTGKDGESLFSDEQKEASQKAVGEFLAENTG